MAIEIKEIEIGELRFQLFPMNAKDQFHLFRRVSPLIAGLGEGFSQLALSEVDGEISDGQMVRAMSPLFGVLSKMEDSECEYIIDKCLNKVRMFNGQQWVPVQIGGRIQFEDVIDMAVMMRLTVEMLQHNGVVSFFSESPAPTLPNGGLSPMAH